MIRFNIPVQNIRILLYEKGDHDGVGFDEDITYVGGDIPIVGCYLVVNSYLYSYTANMVGIIISAVFLH